MSKNFFNNIYFFFKIISVFACISFFIYYVDFFYFILETELYKCYENQSCNDALRKISMCSNTSLVEIQYKEVPLSKNEDKSFFGLFKKKKS